MDTRQALITIESLRTGIPPDGRVREFTVGRASEMKALEGIIECQPTGAVLVQANYGAGKSHLLRVLRETALSNGYAVSYVTVDSTSAVRFNRMDQILGAVCRALETPQSQSRGIPALFGYAASVAEAQRIDGLAPFWKSLTNNWRWDHSSVLDAPAMFVAFRAWATGDERARDTVEDWLYHPWNYRSERKRLYLELISRFSRIFHDPRPEWMFYKDEVFQWHTQGYAQAWAALQDMHALALRSGLKGLVLLFDEFEDIVTNLKNINHRQQAFWNLFEFYGGRKFEGLAAFAVTPGFVKKCQEALEKKAIYDFPIDRFKRIPTFSMSPLNVAELQRLAEWITNCHTCAYGWEAQPYVMLTVKETAKQIGRLPLEDRTRQVIKTTVRILDQMLESQD